MLFKIFRGPEEGLKKIPTHNGYAYFTEDKHNLYIDIGDEPGDRVQVNAYYASVLRKELENGDTKEVDIDDLYIKSEIDKKIADATSVSYTATLRASGWTQSGDKYVYNYANDQLTCGKGGNIPPIITYTSNLTEYSAIDSAEATIGVGIEFRASEKPESDIDIIVIDVK